jgi:hypothetical protein
MSLQDVVPWSLIYGELDKRHRLEIDELVVVIVTEHLIDRSNTGWGKGDKTLNFSINWCLQKGLLSRDALERGRRLYFERYRHLASDDYHAGIIDYYISHLVGLIDG